MFTMERRRPMVVKCRAVVVAIAMLISMLPGPVQANDDGDVVLDWNAIMVTTVSSQNPFAQARFAAITQLAVFEAVNSISGDYDPYLAPIDAPSGASAEAAAVAAAHAVLVNYFPAAAATLDAARADIARRDPRRPVRGRRRRGRQAAAAALIALRTGDGSSPPQFHQPASSDPGVWQTTPTCPPAGGHPAATGGT